MMRNRSEPDQVVQAGFESGRIAVTTKVCGCYCGSARLVRLRRFKIKKLNPPKIKTSKDGQKERTDREVHVGSAGCVKDFQAPAILKTIPLDCKNKAT